MTDDDDALGVGFEIDFRDSFGRLRTLEDLVGETAANVYRQFQRLQEISGNAINTGNAIAQLQALTEGTKEYTREQRRIEASGEGLSRQLARLNDEFGKNRDQIRAAKIETTALAAETLGLTELADRLRGQQAALTAQQQSSVAARDAETKAIRDAAEAHRMFEAVAKQKSATFRDKEALDAATAKEAEARAVREAADAYRMFEAAAKQGASAFREKEALAAAAAKEAEAQSLREAAFAHQMFETAARRGAQAMREAEAATTAAQRALAESARAAEQASRQADAAAAAQAASVASLRSAVDPLAGAQQRLSHELENAVRLYRAGAIGQDEYESSSRALADRIDLVRQAQARQSNDMNEAGQGAQLRSNDLINIGFQLQDIFVSLAAGQNPLIVMIQQGAQLGGIMAQTGVSAGAMAKAIMGMFIVSTPTAAAVATLAAAQTSLTAAQAAATTSGTAAAISSAELAVATEVAAAAAVADANAQRTLALAQAAVASSAIADAAALAALTAAQAAAGLTAAELTAAEAAVATSTTAGARASDLAAAAAARLAAAHTAQAAAASAAAAASTAALAPWLAALAPIIAAMAAAAGAIKLLQNAANSGADMDAYAKSLGLTAKEIRNLDDVTITFGDTTKAVFQLAGAAIWSGIGPAVTSVWDTMKEWAAWIFTGIKDATNFIIGGMVGAYNTITKTWKMLPAAIGDSFYSAVNASIDAINLLVRRAVAGINLIGAQANRILPAAFQLPTLTAGQINGVTNQYKGMAKKVNEIAEQEIKAAQSKDYLGDAGRALVGAVSGRAAQIAQNRIKADAEAKGYLDPEKPEKAKGDKRAENLAREAAAMEVAIKGLYDLAAAYGVSDAAAIKAAAVAKAHEKAIRKQADVEKFVSLELRRAVAERVKDAAKSAADLDYQTDLQEKLNQEVRSGALDIERMSERMSDLTAQREIMAAMSLAGELLDPQAMAASAAALLKLTHEQQRNNAARREAEDLRQSSQIMKEVADIERLTAANATLADRRFAAMSSGLGGFALDQELAAINAENEKALIHSRAQVAIDDARTAGLLKQAEALEKKRDAEKGQIDQDLQIGTLESAMQELRDVSNSIDFAGMFGRGGEAVRDMIGAVHSLTNAQAAHRAMVAAAAGDQTKIAKADALYRSAQFAGQMKAIGGVKTLFKEQSGAYKAISAIEKAMAVWEMANSIRSMVMSKAETAQVVGDSMTQAAANQAAGASKIFSQLGIWAFPVVGAMIAVLASLGMKGGKGSSGVVPPSPEELQASFGTGTVYGDNSAQSESIARSLDLIAANSNSDLEYGNQALRELRSINSGISELAGKLGQQIGMGAAGMFDTSKLNIGASGKGGFFGIGGGSTTRELYDQGLQIYGQSVSQILAGEFNAQVYNVVQQIKKKKGVFGIGGSTKTSYSTSYSAIDAEIKTGFADVLRGVADGVVGVTGIYSQQMADDLRQQIALMRLPEVKFSTQGMSLEEIETALQSYFGSVADQIAGLATQQMPVLNDLRRAGEGMFETLTRVVKTFSTVNIGLSSIGMAGFAQGNAGLAGAAGLSDLFGDLDAYQDAISKFSDKFLTEAERMAPIINAVRAEMERLGHSGVTTTDQFKALVLGLDVNTIAGREMFAQLMAVAPAFAKVIDHMGALDGTLAETADIAKKRRSMEIQIMELQGRTAAALAAKRAQELDALENVLRPMQLYIYALQDEAAAKTALKAAWDRESRDITTLRDKFADLGKTLRDYRATLGSEANPANAYQKAAAEFASAASAAQLGDADAMQKLSQLGQGFLSQSMNNATSQLDYLRDLARVTQAVEGAIGAADEATDYQQAQLDALQQLVARHIDLNDNVLSVRDAIIALEAAQQNMVAIGADVGPIPVIQTTAPPSDNGEVIALRAEIADLGSKLETLISGMDRTAAASEKTNSHYLSRVVDNDAIRVREDG